MMNYLKKHSMSIFQDKSANKANYKEKLQHQSFHSREHATYLGPQSHPIVLILTIKLEVEFFKSKEK